MSSLKIEMEDSTDSSSHSSLHLNILGACHKTASVSGPPEVWVGTTGGGGGGGGCVGGTVAIMAVTMDLLGGC